MSSHPLVCNRVCIHHLNNMEKVDRERRELSEGEKSTKEEEGRIEKKYRGRCELSQGVEGR